MVILKVLFEMFWGQMLVSQRRKPTNQIVNPIILPVTIIHTEPLLLAYFYKYLLIYTESNFQHKAGA